MAHMKRTRVASVDVVEALQAELKKQKAVIAAADKLAKAMQNDFRPTREKSGDERDEMDSALSAYYKARGKLTEPPKPKPVRVDITKLVCRDPMCPGCERIGH